MPVDTKHSIYKSIEGKWDRCRDCFNGRDDLIEAGQKYVPELPGNPEGYNSYINRGNFFNATKRTVKGLAGAIMQKEPTFNLGNIPEEYLKDFTLGDVSAETFVGYVLDKVLLAGRTGILVDMSANPGTTPRPYAVMYDTKNIINWREESIGGDDVLTRVVLKETMERRNPKDQFELLSEEIYRVLDLVDGKYIQTVWRKAKEGSEKYAADEPIMPVRMGDALPFIPFTFVGPTSGSPNPELPPLLDLVDVNLAHWRNSVDYEYALHLLATPTPWVSGHKDKGDGMLKFGASVLWELEKEGSAGFLEYSGSGIDSIKEAMKEKKIEMATLGVRMLEEAPSVQETAAAVGIRHSGEHATLRTVAQSVEQRLTRVFQIIAWWMGSEKTLEEAESSVELNKDFFAPKLTAQDLQSLVFALQAESISFETFYYRLQTGDFARPGIDAEEELKEIARTPFRKEATEE